MKIIEAIDKIKKYCDYKDIDPIKTRDQILYGDSNQEIKKIALSCYASIDVIKKAIEYGANFIIVHEAMFYLHGDKTDWLEDYEVFKEKKKLLYDNHICVWRFHDHIHRGIKNGDIYTDGIFLGMANELGLYDYLIESNKKPEIFEIEKTTVKEFATSIKEKLDLNGIKIIGSLDSEVKRVWACGHIMSFKDQDIMIKMEKDNIDTLLVFECIDYTVSEFVRDYTMINKPKTIIAVGHFNLEEPGMKYMLNYINDILGDVDCSFIKSTDMYNFI